MSFPFYKQYDSKDCGPTCLQMISKHYGKSITLQTLRDKTQIGKEGVSLLGISEAAETIGFRTRSVKLDYKSLTEEAILPTVLHWNQNHFVVLYKVKKGLIYIADPARGLVQYTSREFKTHWIGNKENGVEEGISLLLEPTGDFYVNLDETEESRNKGLAFGNIYNYILPYKSLLFQLFIGLGVGSLLQLFLPFLAQSVIDNGVNRANIHFVYIVLLAQLALFTGRLVVEFIRSWILMHISSRISISILTDFLIKLMKLPVSFFDGKVTGDILQRMNDHKRIETFLTGSSINAIFSIVNLVLFSIVLAVFNTHIFIVFLIASVLYSLWVIIFLKKRKALDYKRFDVAAKEQSATIQLIQGMQEIKLNGVEKPLRWSWEQLQVKQFKLSMKGLSLGQRQQTGAFFINEGKNIFITFLSAKAVIDGQMTLGTMMAVQYIIGQLNSPIEQMIGFIQSWQNAKISLDRLNEIRTMEDEEPSHKLFQQELPPAFAGNLVGGYSPLPPTEGGEYVNDTQNPLSDTKIYPNTLLGANSVSEEFPAFYEGGPAIKIENLSFTYPGAGNEPVLKHINLSIPKGRTTAIVGTSGSGKTTLLKLLLKFYDPQKGEIRLDGTLLANISHKVWRSHCGAVMQESFIFSDTIARNIAAGADRVDMKRLYQAVDIANIREFIENLPLGYSTKIGAEGKGISMGQKQRILIARAVYRNPDFIFFDEATNSLDANNESEIINKLESFLTGKTVVIVAHRLSTVKHADQIVVLTKGVIVERGTHEELVNLKGEYYILVKNQLDLGA